MGSSLDTRLAQIEHLCSILVNKIYFDRLRALSCLFFAALAAANTGRDPPGLICSAGEPMHLMASLTRR